MGADLSEANLKLSDFPGANLRGAHLKGAYFLQTNLQEAALSEAAFYDAISDDRTIWPAGFNPKVSEKAETSDEDFKIFFHPDLLPQQVKTALEALADYFRLCGGAGFKFDPEFQTVSLGEPEYVGR
jgi:uncharacterized protein YjbI with pentapeptide repeats